MARPQTVKKEELYGILGEYFKEVQKLLENKMLPNHTHGLEDVAGIHQLVNPHKHSFMDIKDIIELRKAIGVETDSKIDNYIKQNKLKSADSIEANKPVVPEGEHKHVFADISNPVVFLDFIKIHLRPLPVLADIEAFDSKSAEVAFNIIATGYYYLDGMIVNLEYKSVKDEKWETAFSRVFNKVTLVYGYIIENLKPNTEYEVRVRLTDKFNDELDEKSAVKTFKTSKASASK